MSLPVDPADVGRLNIPLVADLIRERGVERPKCRWCGTWALASSAGAFLCPACDGATRHPSTREGNP